MSDNGAAVREAVARRNATTLGKAAAAISAISCDEAEVGQMVRNMGAALLTLARWDVPINGGPSELSTAAFEYGQIVTLEGRDFTLLVSLEPRKATA